jgi:cyclophilin family peptidyl-prolyl cis-trans isomerase
MKNLFKSFLKSGLRPASRRFAARRRSRSAAEWLEARTLLTGNVQAIVSGGNLILTGDVDSNEVSVSFDFAVSNIVVNGLNGTTINGSADPFIAFNGTQRMPGAINATLGDGDDTLTINDVIALDNIEIDGGAGNDTIGLNNAHSGDNVELHGGLGNDRIEINISGIDDNLTINGGDGDDSISIEVSVVDDFAQINGGAGNDVLGLNRLSVGDDLTVNLGDGDDTLIANRVSTDDNAFIDSGAGNDTLRIETGFSKDNMSVETGDGDDSVFFRGNIVIDDLRVGTGDGNDTLDFQNSLAQDNLFVNTGNGDDTVIYDASAVDDLIDLRTEGGADTVVFMNSVFHHNLRVDTGSGDDLLFAESSTIGDSANIQTGSGADTLEVDAATRLGRRPFISGVETTDADDNVIDDLLNNPTTGILTLAAQMEAQLLANFAPTVLDDTYSPISTGTVDAAAGVLANDTSGSLDGTLTATVLTTPANGAVVLNPDGSFTYTPNDGFVGTDTFTYLATDAFGATATGTVTLTVDPLDLVLDSSANSAVISSDTLIVNDPTFVVQGTTGENATIEVDSDGDGAFDDASTTADGVGSFSVNVMLTNDATNLGANNIQVRATSGLQQTTESLNVHFAEGTVVRFDTTLGSYDVELLDMDAPNTVGAFLDDLSRYDDSIVHRNIDEFVIQGGGFSFDDINTTIVDVVDFPAPPNEFSAASPLNSNVRGTLSTAQTNNPNTFTGQWFVNTVDNLNLDNVPHTVFGRVIGSGMDVVDAINNTATFSLNGLLPNSSALSQVPLLDYSPTVNGGVPVDANFIKTNVAKLLDPIGSENTFRVLENAANGTEVGQVVSTNAATAFALDSPNDTFALDQSTGIITVADSANVDFEANPVFIFNISATNGTTETISVTVNVIDAFNDQPFGAVTGGAFDDPTLLGIRTDLVAGAPAISEEHVDTAVDYTGFSNPPTYGPHHGSVAGITPRPTGVYSTEQPDEDLVHNLEHGHVWISYNPTLLSDANRVTLENLVRDGGDNTGVILTPRLKNETAIALASWAHLLTLDDFDATQIRNFIETNRGHSNEGFILSGQKPANGETLTDGLPHTP